MQTYYCKAGFQHAVGAECDHIAKQTFGKLPRDHDTTVINDQGQVTRTYKLGGFYSEEETALRREANRVKYMPAWKRELK